MTDHGEQAITERVTSAAASRTGILELPRARTSGPGDGAGVGTAVTGRRAGRSPRDLRAPLVEIGSPHRTVHHIGGEIDKTDVVVAGVVAEAGERLVHVEL